MRTPLIVLGSAAIVAAGVWLAVATDGNQEGPTPPKSVTDATGPGTPGRSLESQIPDGSGMAEPIASSAFAGEAGSSDDTPRVQVQLLDHDGAPIPCVELGLRDDADPDPTALRTRATTTAPDGIAVLDFPQGHAWPLPSWRIVVLLPVVIDPPFRVTHATTRKDPIMIGLPATAALEIRALDEGGRAVTRLDASLRIEACAQDGGRIPGLWPGDWPGAVLDDQGRALLPAVGLGRRFRAAVLPLDPIGDFIEESTEGPGPTDSNERARLDVTVRRDRFPVVTGRFVRSDGTPWPACTLECIPAIIPSDTRRGYQWFPVESGGRFRLVLRDACPPGGSRIYVIEDRDRNRWPDGLGPETRLDLSRPFGTGDNEIGDVTLDLGPIVVAGEVLDDQGRPVAGAEIRVTVAKPFVGGTSQVRVVGHAQPVSRPGGRFEVRLRGDDVAPVGEVQVSVAKEGFLGRDQKTVASGTRDLRIVMTRGGGLAGSVKIAGTLRGGDLAVWIRSERMTFRRGIGLDGRFRYDGLPPGTVTVTIVPSSGSGAALATIDGVVISPGIVNAESRLQDLEIAAAVRRIRIQVLDAGRRPIPKATVRLEDAGRGETRRADETGTVEVSVFTGVVRFFAGAPGYQSRRVESAEEEIEVLLATGIAIRIRNSELTQGAEAPYRLEVLLCRADDRGRPATDPVLDPDAFNHVLGAGGGCDAILPGPGVWLIRPSVRLRNPGGGFSNLAQFLPNADRSVTVVDAGTTQMFDIELSQEMIDARLMEAGR